MKQLNMVGKFKIGKHEEEPEYALTLKDYNKGGC